MTSQRPTTIRFELDTFTDHGTDYAAVCVRWSDINDLLGREHEGTSEDDERIVKALLASGAPAWAESGSGATDEDVWALLGPKANDSVDVCVTSVKAGDYTPGCVDADVTVTAGGRTWCGGVTLYPNEGRPTVGRRHPLDTCGTPLEVWASDDIKDAVRVLGNGLVGEIEYAVDEAARKSGH